MRVLKFRFVPFLIGLSFCLFGPQAFAQCEISVYTPNLGWQVESGISFPILWCATGSWCAPTVGISLWNDGVFVQDITLSTTNDGRYDWSVPGDLVGGAYSIQIWETGGGLVAIGNSTLFEFVQYTPFCQYAITSPMCSNWIAGDTQTISWEGIGYACGNTVDLDLGCDGIDSGNIAQDIPNTGSTQWTIPEGIQCIGAAYVQLEDSAGALGSSMFFSIFSPIFADGFESGNLNDWSAWISGPLLLVSHPQSLAAGRRSR